MAKPKIKEYLVIDSEGIHEYTIRVKKIGDGNRYRLHASNGGEWSEPYKGQEILELLDDGNQVTMSSSEFGKTLEYDLVAALHILVSFANKKERYTGEYQIIKKSIKHKK
jgi:hypothetical protein